MSNKKDLKKDILKRLDEINSKKVKPVYIPSLEKEVNFKPFTVKHQKEILESTVDNILFHNQFKLRTYEIIKELSTEPIVDVVNVIDRDIIMFQLRYYSIGEKWDDIDLTEKFEKIKETKFLELIPKEYQNEDIFIPIFVPTLKYEYTFLKEFLRTNSLEVFDMNNLNEVRKQTGLLYFTEIYKYIQKVIFKENEFILDLYSNEFSLSDKFEIIYNMDKDILSEITDCIKEFKEPLSEFLKVDDETTIEIDPNFFQ